MKRMIAALFAVIFVFTLASCTKSSGTISSVEELAERANCALICPAGVELTNETFTIIPGEPEIAEHTFEIDGTKCMLRFAKAGIETDISGVTTEKGSLFANREADTLYIENDELRAKSWLTVDGQYVLVVFSPDWDWTDFENLCKQYADMKPVNWSSEVPFETYKAMEGSYTDEAYNMATITVKGDHVSITAVVSLDETTRKVWDMEAELKDGKLVYDKETISVNTYDMDAGETVTEEQEDGGAGYIVVDGNEMILSGCYSEELRDLVLTKQDLF